MADKKVAITCEGFKARRQEGNGFEAGKLTDVPGLQEIELELEQGNEPVYADGVKKLNLFSGITGATVTANLMELNKEEREQFLGVKVENGMELYTSDLVPPYVSVSWKYRCNDGSFIYYGLTRGNFNIPNTSASTMEDSPEQQDQIEMEGSFVQRDKDKLVYARIHSADPEFDEAAFYKAIHGDDAVTTADNTPAA
ncbi:major tail protein [Staphylococcus borealis]|uniref:major tail protein n=1 Tax=Staphylococcus borealis TaxID=2742203 RepID=UPI00374EA821